MKLSCPRLDRPTLVKQLKQLGLSSGDIVMVHASLRNVGEILGGPDILIESIIEATSPHGTMMMYTGCQSPYDDIGRGIYSEEDEAFMVKRLPAFDARRARANRDYGALAELFRTYNGAQSSRNPGARMTALGAKADVLTKEHPMNYGYGKDSPLERLCTAAGKVLLLGSDRDQVTLLHYAESVADIKDKYLVNYTVPIEENGVRRCVAVEEHNTSTGICDWPDRFFAVIIDEFVRAGNGKSGMVGSAESLLLHAKSLVDFARAKMVEVKNSK